MDGYEAATYGDRIAGVYDSWYAGANERTIAVLSELAGPGPVLELGVGTGRVALPLSERGVEVFGIDASAAMLDRLGEKPGADRIRTTVGDFSVFKMGRRFALVYVVFNTFFALVDQSSQLDCFRSVANHLMPGGRFLLECFVPDLARFDRNQRMGTSRVGDRQVVLEASRHHPASQRVESQHVILGSEGNELIPVSIRYVWPAEMDLMAHIAGFELEKRSGGWAGEPFDDMSNTHVSVYRLR